MGHPLYRDVKFGPAPLPSRWWVTLTHSYVGRGFFLSSRFCEATPCLFPILTTIGDSSPLISESTVVARHRLWSSLPRSSLPTCWVRLTMGDTTVYCLRSFFLCFLVLSFFSQKTSACRGHWGLLAPRRDCPFKPFWSPPIKHACAGVIGSDSNLSAP